MREPLPELGEEDGLAIVFRDVLVLLALCYMTVALFVVPFVRQVMDADRDRRASPVGAVSVELVWTRGDGADSESDFDLWVQSPLDSAPVGFRNKVGRNFSLLRDDLGRGQTLGSVRFEFASALQPAAGEWIVNGFLYRFADPGDRILYTVRVLRTDATGRSAELYTGSGVVYAHEREVTLVRFRLDDEGRLVPGSPTTLFRPLVSS